MSEYVTPLAKLRKRLDLSQEDVARAIGVSVGTIRNWEQSRTKYESIVRFAKLCKVLQCAPSDLIDK